MFLNTASEYQLKGFISPTERTREWNMTVSKPAIFSHFFKMTFDGFLLLSKTMDGKTELKKSFLNATEIIGWI